ncbi:MAG: transglutaminase N-terminal domain-containing protein [Verrucomicrobiota bacterium]
MATHASIYHRTTYHYDRPIRLWPHVVRHPPAPHCRTPILSYSLRVQPEEHFVNLMQDPYGNYSTRLVFPEKTTKFEVIVDLVADMTAINPFDFFLEEYAETFPFRYEDSLRLELEPYLKVTDSCDDLRDLASRFEPRSSITTNDFLVEVNQELEKLIDYNIRMEPGVQSCQETLEKHSGSCRDSAFLLTSSFAPSASPPGSSQATSFSSPQTRSPSTDRRVLRRTSPISTPGQKCFFLELAGSVSIPHPDYLLEKVTFP